MGTRDRILDAAAEIMRTDGIARATTKEIAQRAGYSEATLYKHFGDKTEIFGAVLQERLPELSAALRRLSAHAGQGRVRDNLYDVVRAALDFYDEGFPMAVGLFSERRLLESHRAAIVEKGAGPRHVNIMLGAYLRAEREQGRIAPHVDPDATAELLMGACFQRAFYRHFYGETTAENLDTVASALVDTVLGGIEPEEGRGRPSSTQGDV